MLPYERNNSYWTAFILGPFWYYIKGMQKKALWLLFLCIITFFLAVPFIWLYCGFKAQRDYDNFLLRKYVNSK